ncbi:hypothetical protein [Bacillus sp. HSf4]|uniref:hypothetical protein n=1 Tax=Bacillus sp. HSf4 TaxID=3035514 RepID=UPI002409F389|nr:hypothetical protein [Bacillus sp. HSf4]WFA06268.1 hypothetical protein P3X63_05620 [Bacillus sp. HSf4]
MEDLGSPAAKEWKSFWSVSLFLVLGAAGTAVFNPVFQLEDMPFRIFDVFIISVLIANGLYFWQRHKGIAFVSFLLGLLNLGLLAALILG